MKLILRFALSEHESREHPLLLQARWREHISNAFINREDELTKPLVLHEDTFYEYFKPIRHPEARYDIWGGHGLETFGDDLEIVRRHNSAFVWTVVDGDSGTDEWIITGIHYVNRICYLITEIPHNWIDVAFRERSRPSSLTGLGLRRQMSSLKQSLDNLSQ